MSDYTPEEAEFIDTYVSAMSGGCTPIEDPERTAEARRGIAKVKADALREAAGIAMEHGRGGLIASDAIIRRAREIEQENAAEPSEPEMGEDAK